MKVTKVNLNEPYKVIPNYYLRKLSGFVFGGRQFDFEFQLRRQKTDCDPDYNYYIALVHVHTGKVIVHSDLTNDYCVERCIKHMYFVGVCVDSAKVSDFWSPDIQLKQNLEWS